VRDFLLFAGIQAIYYIDLVVNIRALAHLQYGWAVGTDGIAALLTWTLIKKVGNASGKAGMAGYIIGGMIGSLIGMLITKAWG
jgi:hypothetical protein